jgi:hypothetical protein
MECTDQIQMQGVSPGKLKGNFSGTDLPKYIRVKGTSDANHVSASGNWISRQKYSSLAQTLELMDESQGVIKECQYNAEGRYVPPVVNQCFVSYGSPYLTFIPMDNGTLEVDLFFTSERQVVSHNLMRRGENDNDFRQIGESIPYNAGANGFYNIVDPSPVAGFTLYSITTNFSSCGAVGSDATLYQS